MFRTDCDRVGQVINRVWTGSAWEDDGTSWTSGGEVGARGRSPNGRWLLPRSMSLRKRLVVMLDRDVCGIVTLEPRYGSYWQVWQGRG